MKLSFATSPALVGRQSLLTSESREDEHRVALLRQGYRDLLSDVRDGLVFRPASDRDVAKKKRKGAPS